MCFMLHQDELWAYSSNSNIEKVSGKAHNLYYLSEDKVFFMESSNVDNGAKTVTNSVIMMIECLFGSYLIT